MAADSDKTQIAQPETPAEPAKSGKSKNLLLFGGIGAGIVVIGVALAMFVLKPMLGSDEAATTEPTKATQVDKKEAKKEPEKKAKAREAKKGEGEASVVAIKDVVINPAGTAGSRFLSVSFGFEMESAAAVTEFESKEMQIRDALITILSSKTMAELTDPKQKELIRAQIKKRVSQILQSEELAGVYYTDFVLQ